MTLYEHSFHLKTSSHKLKSLEFFNGLTIDNEIDILCNPLFKLVSQNLQNFEDIGDIQGQALKSSGDH